jgi:hypothetical protein
MADGDLSEDGLINDDYHLLCLASSSFVKKSARKVLRLVIVKRA